MTAPRLPASAGWMGDPSRGAAMGRVSDRAPADTPKFYLRRIRLDTGGYDSGGAYWGIGAPLYWATTETDSPSLFFRAADRESAKAKIRADYPGSRFYA